MKFPFPINDISLKEAEAVPSVDYPLSSGELWQANSTEFALQVPGVGDFYVRDGAFVEYTIVPGADPGWVKLYLYGQVLVALLHQRKILNFHASSFIYAGRGIMILGETGAGKSSLTVSFVLRQEGHLSSHNAAGETSVSGFLTDDLTPVIFREEIPYIWPLGRRVKIREGTVAQLNIDSGRLADAEVGTGKKYLSLVPAGVEDHALHTILKIETGDVKEPVFQGLSAAEKFSLLRSEVCSWEMLAGMPETEAAYLQQLVKIVEQVSIVRVVRPVEIEIVALHAAVRNYLSI
jgi:hypothetical protein